MKRLLLSFLTVLISVSCFAKKKSDVSVVDSYTFYGVNFEKCHIFAWGQDAEQTITSLSEINRLFVREMKKYDLTSLNKKVNDMVIEVSIKQTLAKDPQTLETFKELAPLSTDTIQSVIKQLELKENEGYGLMIFGDYLNKHNNKASYKFVFFDIATRELVEIWNATGEARGFGYRNYWAKSIYNVLKNGSFNKTYYKQKAN